MANQTYSYTVHRTGAKRALVRGKIRKSTLEKAITALQRKIKKTVTKQKIPLFLRVWNLADETERFERQYVTKKDFRLFRRPPKWRQALSRKAKYSSQYDPTPTAWFVAIGKRGQIDLTKLAYTPEKQTLLRKKRKKVFGPFEDEAAASQFADKVRARLEERIERRSFSQRRRYKGSMTEEENGK